jgi:hypothetical protein
MGLKPFLLVSLCGLGLWLGFALGGASAQRESTLPTTAPEPTTTSPPPTPPDDVFVPPSRTQTAHCRARGPLPDTACTPGALFTAATASEVCVHGYSASVRNVPTRVKRAVYAEYGIRRHRRGEYEVDHLISLELGGSNAIANLWPEAAAPRPGFHQKDTVENALHDRVCSGTMTLAAAQRIIATNWLDVLAAVPLAAAPPRTLVAGPALAGKRVVWGEQRDSLSVLRAWPDNPPLWQNGSSWFAGPLAGSPRLVAFSRSYDGCPDQPGVACPVETQALAGPPHGSLRALGAPERCVAGGPSRRLAVSGYRVAFLEIGCNSPAPSVTVHNASRTVFRRQGVSCCDLALAGRYLAFRNGRSVRVIDLRTRRLVYRVDPPAGSGTVAFDIEDDGKIAVVFGPTPDGRTTVAWRARETPELHRLALSARLAQQGPAIRIVDDRIVFDAQIGSSSASQLVVADLQGRVRVVARFSGAVEQAGAFDATPAHVTWASRQITGTRVDCPPPGQERPCRLLKSGIETIWLAGLTSGTPRTIARWPFSDAP